MTSTEGKGFYYAEVVSALRLSAHMIRVVFGGKDIAEYESVDVPDECVALYFARDGEHRPPPMTLVDGAWGHHGVANPPDGRNYTVRRFDQDAGEMTVDFATHEGGVASTWAGQAEAGQEVLLTPPRCWYTVPADTHWQLLVADMAGLPALGRIVEELAPGTRAHVIAEVSGRDDITEFSTDANVTYDWLVGSGNGVTRTVLIDAIRNFEPLPGTGYVWFAGEASDSRDVRKVVRSGWGFSRDRFDIIGYWRADAERWTAKFEREGDEAIAAYTRALEEGRSEKEASEVFDDMLEKVGL